MLVGFHLISVANTFPFLQFSLGFNNWTCLAWLLHHKKRKKNMTSLLWRHDLTTSLGLNRPSHKQRTTQPTWVTLVFLVFLDITWKLVSLLQKQCLHPFMPDVVLHVKQVKWREAVNKKCTSATPLAFQTERLRGCTLPQGEKDIAERIGSTGNNKKLTVLVR